MKIQVGEDLHEVKFIYDPAQRWTWAKFDDCIGIAERRSQKDQYCKRVGRKIALSRALEMAGLDRDYRRKVWAALQSRGMKLI